MSNYSSKAENIWSERKIGGPFKIDRDMTERAKRSREESGGMDRSGDESRQMKGRRERSPTELNQKKGSERSESNEAEGRQAQMKRNRRRRKKQGCIKFLIPHCWGGGLLKPAGEEYQVLKKGREYHGCGEEYNADKGEAISPSL